MSLIRSKPAAPRASPSVAPADSEVRSAAGPVAVAGPLHVRLRPPDLSGVIGHAPITKSIDNLLRGKNVPHSFLLTGPSGTGKTTLGRIIGAMVGCTTKEAVIEIDAARYSGVDNMRDVIAGSRFASLSENARKIFIVDEAHRLSRGAWDSLLLSIEEPPPHVWWVFCSTEPDKIPATIRTRCHAFDLKPVPWEAIADYLLSVVKSEGLKLPQPEADLVGVLARRSMGSVRQALVFLSSVNGVADKQTALSLIDSIEDEEGNPKQLARMICANKNFSWPAATKLIQSMKDESPETVRLIVVAYACAMLMDEKITPASGERLLAVLDAFRGPYNQSERQAPLFLAVGQLLF